MSIDTTPSTGSTGAVSSTSGKDDFVLGWDTKQEEHGLAPLTEIQNEALKILTEKFSDMDGLGMVLDSVCYQRYLRARKWNVKKAIDMLEATLKWRKEFGVQKLLEEEMHVVAKENETGKIYLKGYDRAGYPIMYMVPSRENTSHPSNNLKHLVYNLERARSILQRCSGGYGKMTLVIDFLGYSMRNSLSLRSGKLTVNILQDHYPETLGRAYFVNPPWIFSTFYTVVSPFIDEDTKRKFVFIKGDPALPPNQKTLESHFVVETLEQFSAGIEQDGFNSSVYVQEELHYTYNEDRRDSFYLEELSNPVQ